MRMPNVVFREERCKGCLLCTEVCPKQIITPCSRFNQQGYKLVEILPEAAERCIGCGFCAMICPDQVIRVWKEAKAEGS